jgi:hypothetical protein
VVLAPVICSSLFPHVPVQAAVQPSLF